MNPISLALIVVPGLLLIAWLLLSSGAVPTIGCHTSGRGF